MGAAVAFVNLGCRVNRVEIDLIASELLRAGCRRVEPGEADAIVVNSCAVTGEAEAKTRKLLRHMSSLPHAPLVCATGCVVSLFADELRDIAPNVLVEPQKSRVARLVLDELGVHEGAVDDSGQLVLTPTATGRCRPGIKIQDGCDNRCSYCIVWKARGPARSLAADKVVESVREAAAAGGREVVLTGINLGSYRSDDLCLPDLLELLMGETEVGRVRLGSIEPPDVTQALLEVMARHEERIAPFLHVCLQSGCDSTLARMGRVYDSRQYRKIVSAARKALPRLALGTDLIVGFPGETDEEFERGLAFCRDMRFAKMHVFRYSKRPGTPAAKAPDQVPPQLMAERSRRLRSLAREMRHASALECVGRRELALVQGGGRGVTGGLFDVALDPSLAVDTLVHVTPTSVLEDGTLVALRA
ncbi:MiaB/RimO family radical SAM methylthiotransferase [Olsenella urininfantis]|uniref:MiaB/RimO family radical SAM methylthiotransferase n=1 Tax=Olsenella urininfantis TaxID=1871033 RepID=UPI0009847757|nr:MiaB/RimO family radical SAM methylthiotransferase [Olsenella urininfantis]